MLTSEAIEKRKMLQKRIGANIRYKREKTKISIGELAKNIPMSESFLGLIERGARGTCLDNLIFIADYFSMTLDELILHNLEAEEKMAEKDKELRTEYKTLSYLIQNLNEEECKFVISVIKSMKNLK